MGATSSVLTTETNKPLDASDIDTPRGQSAKEEVRRLRKLLQTEVHSADKSPEVAPEVAVESNGAAHNEAADASGEKVVAKGEEGQAPETEQSAAGDAPATNGDVQPGATDHAPVQAAENTTTTTTTTEDATATENTTTTENVAATETATTDAAPTEQADASDAAPSAPATEETAPSEAPATTEDGVAAATDKTEPAAKSTDQATAAAGST